ncbi:MAG: AAA family ATPase [Phycisphaerales bacterium]
MHVSSIVRYCPRWTTPVQVFVMAVSSAGDSPRGQTMRAIAIINQKGGCGKTTSAINLSAVLARAGKKVLLIDMDPQGHCAAGLGIPEQRIELDIGDAMLTVGSKPLDPSKLLWRVARNLDLAPARMKLAGLEAPRGGLADLPDKERRLSQVIEKFGNEYDIAVVDCPPSIGMLTFNALACADMVMIPVETGFFSLQGATRQVNTVKTLSKRLGVNIPVWLLPTLHDARNTVAADLLDELNRRFNERVVSVVVRHDVRLREAASFGQSVIDYAPGSMGAEDYGRLGIWTLENLKPRAALPADQIETVVSGAGAGSTESFIGGVSLSPSTGTGPSNNKSFSQYGAGQDNGGVATMATAENASEVKPVSRAEDVARRAQEFLRRIALGRTPSPETTSQASAAVAATNTSTATQGATAVMATQALSPQGAETLPNNVVTIKPSRQVLRLEEEPITHQPILPSTQRLLGLRETSQGVLFVQPMTAGKTISIAGSFNNWSPTAHVMKRNQALGIYELCLRLPAGKFQYRIVVDGTWQNDPYNPNTEPNPFGEVNNIGYVGAK